MDLRNVALFRRSHGWSRSRAHFARRAKATAPGAHGIMALARAADMGQSARPMGAYPGRKQVRKRAKRAVKNDRIIAKKAAAKK
jgi:hypothetical protein